MVAFPPMVEDLPNICGSEATIERAIAERPSGPVYAQSRDSLDQVRSVAAIALHMHQPLSPSGGPDLHTAGMIGNLQHMTENQGLGDNHNAPVFQWCYKRMGDFIPQLVSEGKSPRCMLDYSGTLLHGLVQMGAWDVLDSLKRIACDPAYMRCAEWLGTPWGHAVAPSTPVADYRMQVRAWQHHFASIFGIEALQRVRGFSPSEMALPNHPDVAYAFVKTLRDCGFTWVLVQEHSVERPGTGGGPEHKHLPHRLDVVDSKGNRASITAIIKTQGSDTKLVAQMQPWFEAKSLARQSLAGRSVPPLVTQIADGENGGVMMNEFPPQFIQVVREASSSDVPLMNATEYLEHLEAMGITEADFPALQPVHQRHIWERFSPGDGAERLEKVIAELEGKVPGFHMLGGTWTDDISWVRGYDNVLGPMEEVSVLFHEKVVSRGVPTDDPRYRNAFYHVLISQSSDYRYWGQGQWTDYGREVCRRAKDILTHDF